MENDPNTIPEDAAYDIKIPATYGKIVEEDGEFHAEFFLGKNYCTGFHRTRAKAVADAKRLILHLIEKKLTGI